MTTRTRSTRDGCHILRDVEKVEGGRFMRLCVRGEQAVPVLVAEVQAFYQLYPPLTSAALALYRLGPWWCCLVAGRAARRPKVASAPRPPTWMPADVLRLRRAYADGGRPACLAAFPQRSKDSVNSAVRRYGVRQRHTS